MAQIRARRNQGLLRATTPARATYRAVPGDGQHGRDGRPDRLHVTTLTHEGSRQPSRSRRRPSLVACDPGWCGRRPAWSFPDLIGARAGGPFDDFAAEYDRLLDGPLRRPCAGANRALLMAFRARLGKAPWRELAVGCGQGAAMSFLADHCAIVGTDLTPRRLQQRPANTWVVVPKPFDLPFVSGSFDAAFASCTYHHIQAADHVRHLRELSRVVRPGGLVAIFEHNPLNPITGRVFTRAPVDRGCEMIPCRHLTEAFREANLEELRHRYVRYVQRFCFPALGFLEPQPGWIPFGSQYYVAGRTGS